MPDQRVSLFCRVALLPEGFRNDVRLTLAGGIITAVTPGARIAPADDVCGIALPGLANLHSHAFQRGMAGLAEHRGPASDSFWTWRAVMYRFLDRMSPDDVEAIAAQAYAEMLEGGFTRVGEFHYLHHDPTGARYDNPAEMAERIAAAAAQTGIGLTLLPCFYAHADFGGAPPLQGQRRFITTLDSFASLHQASRAALSGLPGATLGIAPHSLRAVTQAELGALIAAHPDGPIHIHAAEQTAEVDACVHATAERPVQWLLHHHHVDARWCLIHATHMLPTETASLAATGAVAGLCPLTEASLGDGIFPAATFCAVGGRFGIGTDSNIQIDAAAELRQLEYAQRLHSRMRNVLAAGPQASTGRTLFDQALRGGAQALGVEPAGLAAGAPADIVTLDAAHPALVGRHGDALLDSWIFAAARPCVQAVWRAGHQVVRDGRHIDAARIGARYAACLRRLAD
jgi:formimidoylglutamate deiminase